jgi:hypothetical protein
MTNQADVAQLVEQLIRNQQVTGSSPVVGSTFFQPECPPPGTDNFLNGTRTGRCKSTFASIVEPDILKIGTVLSTGISCHQAENLHSPCHNRARFRLHDK